MASFTKRYLGLISCFLASSMRKRNNASCLIVSAGIFVVFTIDPSLKCYGQSIQIQRLFAGAGLSNHVPHSPNEQIAQAPARTSLTSLMDQALASFVKADYPAAIALWSQLIMANPTVSMRNEALINRSKAYLIIGQPSLALADLAACQYAPNQVSALAELWLLRGSAHLQNKQYTEAIEAFAQSERLRPGNPIIYSNRSVAYQSLGKLAEAKSDISKAIKLHPTFSNYFNLAVLYRQAGNHQACFDLLSQMIKQSQPYGQLFTQRGLCAAKLGRHDEAISDLLKALKLDQSNADAMEQLGLSLAAKNQKESARQYLVRASSLRLTNGQVDDYQRILAIIGALD